LGGCGNAPDEAGGGGAGVVSGSGASGGTPSAGGAENGGSENLGGSAGDLPQAGGAAGSESGGAGGVAGAASEPEPDTGEDIGTGSNCPTNGPPPGPYKLRFDLATLQCGASGVCTGDEDKCFCPPDFAALAALPGHFLAVGGEKSKSTTWGSGNVQAVYVNEFITDWKLGGAQRADAVIAKAKQDFPCGVPKWFLVNEISNSLWPDTPSYRQFVIDFAKRLKLGYGKTVVIAAPFQTIAANAASWTELQKHAYIGVEAYLSGKEIKDNGFSVSWCQAQYAASVAAYAKQGVPKSRLFLFEHFANSDTMMDNGIPIKWGRQAVSAADWHKAIKVRSQAAHNIGFAGFVSYDWGGNGMHAPESDRLAFMNTYLAQTLP
jgi:hypothetical protein